MSNLMASSSCLHRIAEVNTARPSHSIVNPVVATGKHLPEAVRIGSTSTFPQHNCQANVNAEVTSVAEPSVPDQPWQTPDATAAWNDVVETTAKYDNGMIAAWKEELSNLLIFAGLFSAVVTPFNVEAYKWLQPGPEERTNEILAQISSQLYSVSTSTVTAPNFPAPSSVAPTFKAVTADVDINTLWFLSLTFALMAALFAILAQQWVRQYSEYPLVTGSKEALMRQRRFDALHRWLVPQIIMGLAVLLQASLFVFLAGLLILLWVVNQTVAVAITCTVAAFLTGCAVTTIIPTFSTDCPYKSPLAWAFNVPCCAAAYPFVSSFHALLARLAMAVEAWLFSSTQRRFQNPGRLHRSFRAARLRLRRMQRRIRLFRGRISYKSWLVTEEHNSRLLNQDDLICQAIAWTAQTASIHYAESLTPCLLESLGPRKALLQWLAQQAKTSYDDLPRALVEGAMDFDRIAERDPQHLEILGMLVPHACHLALDGSDNASPGYDAALVHIVLWFA